MNFFQEISRIIEEYRNPRRLFSSNIAVLAALLLSLLIGYKSFGIVLKERALRVEVKNLEERVGKAEETNKFLDKEIAQTHTPEVIEKLAKEQLNLQKPGELVAVIVPSASNTESLPLPAPSLWERLKSLIFR
ncbi:MAG: septum formation initiator family protein [Candidatus Sungiibacteriota bacterium]